MENADLNQFFDELARRVSPGDSGGNSGFVEHPQEQGNLHYVFANRQNFPHGFMLDDDGNPVQLPSNAIKGKIIGLAFGIRKNDNPQYDDSPKLCFGLEAGADRFVLEMGYGTNTARGVISALDNDEATPERLERGITVTLEPEPEHQNVLYANVYDAGGEAIIGQASQLKNEDGSAMANAVDRVNNKIQQLSTYNPEFEPSWISSQSSGSSQQSQGQQQAPQQQAQGQQQAGGGGAPAPQQNAQGNAQGSSSQGNQQAGPQTMPTNTMPTST